MSMCAEQSGHPAQQGHTIFINARNTMTQHIVIATAVLIRNNTNKIFSKYYVLLEAAN